MEDVLIIYYSFLFLINTTLDWWFFTESQKFLLNYVLIEKNYD